MKQEIKTWWVESPWSWIAMFVGVAIVFAAFNHTAWIIQHHHVFLLGLVCLMIIVGIVRIRRDRKMTAEEIIEKYIEKAQKDTGVHEKGPSIWYFVVIVVVSIVILVFILR